MLKLRIPIIKAFFVLIIPHFVGLKFAYGSIKCPTNQMNTTKSAIFNFGDPVMFVTTESQNYNPYSLVDSHRRTSILEEYLMVGYHKRGDDDTAVYEQLQMVFYDGVKQIVAKATGSPDLVHQNLEKELYWRYFNSTGIYPSMTIVNTTKRISLQFHAYGMNSFNSSNNNIFFSALIGEREFFKEPQVPYHVIFEIPANSRVLQKEKTLIQYQSFGLWRWRLSETTVEWSDITSKSDYYTSNALLTNFHRVDNPCIKDMFLVYVPREMKGSGPIAPEKLVYLASPLIQSHLGENWFYDMKTKDHPWWPEAPDAIVLTNDHLVVLTTMSMWISNSLNDSTYPGIDLEMAGDVTTRPNLTYLHTNPCDKYEDMIDCFLPNSANAKKYTVHRLFYTPVCYLYQFPFYDDYLIFSVERVINNNPTKPDKDFTVLYASEPYEDWKILFSNVAFYKMFPKGESSGGPMEHTTLHIPIDSIVSIFFNHHMRHFDITLKLAHGTTITKYVRFVLPEPRIQFDGYGELLSQEQRMRAGAVGNKKLSQLNGTMGNGFSEYEFPKDFQVADVVVNAETLDVFFIGNQFWIAEAGGPFLYSAFRGISPVPASSSICDGSGIPGATSTIIKECSFNHPDKTYFCVNDDRRLILAGKIGSRYTPSVIEIDHIEEFIKAQKVNPWVPEYFCDLVQKKSVFATAFSGKILFWYYHEPDDEVKAVNDALSTGCSKTDPKPYTCDDINQWKKDQCNALSSGTAGFRMLILNPAKFNARKQSTDGPLVPFLVDSNTAVIYEVVVPEVAATPATSSYDYFNEVFVAQTISCNNYELLKEDANDPFMRESCELFVRHIKPVEKYLDGFRRVLYVTVVKSIPLLPIPADIVVLVLAQSNKALIKVNDYINTPPWSFVNPDHIGQTLYIPGNFSILLTGFPVANDDTIMQGYTTRHFQHERRFIFRAFQMFLMDLSTKAYREVQDGLALYTINETKIRWEEVDDERTKNRATELYTRMEIEKRWGDSDFAARVPVFQGTPPPLVGREAEELTLLTLAASEQKVIPNQPHPVQPVQPPDPNDLWYGDVPYKDRLIWYVGEHDCHFILSLVNNPVLKVSGGRISLDLYDRISFEVLLRPLTPLGKILMYRQLLVVTNSNPSILRLEMVEKLKGNPQYLQFLLSPTGFRKGVAVVTVRARASSLHCPQSSSLTFIVLCHRDVGRRLHVNYPIPTCKPAVTMGMYPRPWYNEMEGCVTHEELLDPTRKEIIRFRAERKLIAYVTLPTNYRPPSYDGPDIPNTRNVYNADPSKPAYKAWYQVSRESIVLNRCAGKSRKEECVCSDVDRLLDDEEFTECKEKVFFAKRTGSNEPLVMSIVYDRIMRDKDQNPELFLPKQNWSITIEEINGRGEWIIECEHTPYLKMINSDEELHRGRRYYDMNKFKVTLLGTGLFHFKAKLGNIESFGPVTGYFAIFVNTDDINHVHLFMILLVTIIFCMSMVFVGFLVNRKRLSSMLPIQPMSHKRKLKLL